MSGSQENMDSGNPKSSFQSQAAEGDIMWKQGEYRKAIDAYTRALGFRADDKNVLLSRAKCFLSLGDAQSSLEDAEKILSQNPDSFKAKYQKAESLYAMGDFETALLFYHRGLKSRPEMDEFRLGIQKAREAIDNSIGTNVNPRDYRLQVEKVEQRRLSTAPVSQLRAGNANANERRQSTLADRNAKQLLGEMYDDLEYLENLLNDKDFEINVNEQVRQLALDGVKYLEARMDFWRQQRPVYTRRKESIAPVATPRAKTATIVAGQ